MFLVDLYNNIFSENLLGIVLTLSFLASIVTTVFCFAKDTTMLIFFFGFLAYVTVMSKLVVKFSHWMCMLFKRTIFVGHKNANVFETKPKALKKVGDQMWQLFLHLSSVLFEMPVVRGNPWWQDPTSCFSPCPCLQVPSLALKLMYAFESAAYIYDGIAHRFWNARKNDYYVMFLHHICTALLIAGSYYYNYFAFGSNVMFLHDISDIAVDMLIIVNQLKLEGGEWFFIVEIQYVITTLDWFIFRNVLFPIKLLKPLVGVTDVKECFPTTTSLTVFRLLEVLLGSLYFMHIYWLYVFLRIGWDICTMSVGDNREGSYENDSKEKKQ